MPFLTVVKFDYVQCTSHGPNLTYQEFNSLDSPLQFGTIRFGGMTEFAAGQWAGVELDEEIGKNDGSYGGIRYFTCKPKYGEAYIISSALFYVLASCVKYVTIDELLAVWCTPTPSLFLLSSLLSLPSPFLSSVLSLFLPSSSLNSPPSSDLSLSPRSFFPGLFVPMHRISKAAHQPRERRKKLNGKKDSLYITRKAIEAQSQLQMNTDLQVSTSFI